MKKLQKWLRQLLKCKHNRNSLRYKLDGGTICPIACDYVWEDEVCSRPVYTIICLDCGERWYVAEYDVIDFLIRELPQ